MDNIYVTLSASPHSHGIPPLAPQAEVVALISCHSIRLGCRDKLVLFRSGLPIIVKRSYRTVAAPESLLVSPMSES